MLFKTHLVSAVTVLTLLLPVVAHAGWGAADDEANRQRMMNSMRQTAYDNDQRNFANSQNNSYRSSTTSGSSSYSGSGSSSSSSSGGIYVPPSDPVPTGPQSVVATYRFVIQVNETEAQTVARVLKEAESGDVQSQFNIARIYYTGYGATPRDDAQARKWFGKAADQGHPAAAAQYSAMLYNGQGGPEDVTGARTYAKVAADAGDPYGKALSGWYVISDTAATPDTPQPEAVALLIEAAEQDQVLAQAALGGLVYYYGTSGEAVDGNKAVKYLKMATEAGDPTSTGILAELYLSGSFVDNNPQEGIRLLEKAADGGFARSQYLYGLMLLQGKMLPQDNLRGVTYVRKAAEQGNADAQYIYADCLYFGQGVDKDVIESARWMQKAAKQGHAEAAKIMEDPEMVEASKQL